jgi:hypothetical protein
MWKTVYHIKASRDAVLFLDHLVFPGDPFPSTLMAVKSMHLIVISGFFWETETPKGVTLLAELLLSGRCSLEELDLEIQVGASTCVEVINCRKSHSEVLEVNLR